MQQIRTAMPIKPAPSPTRGADRWCASSQPETQGIHRWVPVGEAVSEFPDILRETGCSSKLGLSEMLSLQYLSIGMLCAYLLRVIVSIMTTFLAQSSGWSAPLAEGGSGTNF